MDLQISVFLLFVLFTAGHSLRCYECDSSTDSCADQKVQTCPSESTQCSSSAGVTKVGEITVKAQAKGCTSFCLPGSSNFGIIRTFTTCCKTDLCNRQDAPEPSNVPNGKKCYYCDGKSCSNTLTCYGDEDRCLTETDTSGGQTVVVKGCASKSFCDATTSAGNVKRTTCCEGNLCNGDQSNGAPSVSQSFLFLCCSLLSYFLLH